MNNETNVLAAVKPKSKKGLIAVIIILLLMVIGLAGYIAYDILILDNNPVKEEKVITTTKPLNVVGRYVGGYKYQGYLTNVENNDGSLNEDSRDELLLNKDGTFLHNLSEMAPMTDVGTYKVKNNILTLYITKTISTGCLKSIHSPVKKINYEITNNGKLLELDDTNIILSPTKATFNGLDAYGCDANGNRINEN